MTQIVMPTDLTDQLDYGYARTPDTPEASNRRRLTALLLDPASRIPTYVGIVLVAVGFALIGIAWAKVAALLNVALQLPYLVSAGFTGLALVMVGLVIVNVAAKRQDAAARTRQLERLTSILQELQQDLATSDE